MIDDSQYGSRDKRGHLKPFKLSSNIPFFDWPFSITKNLKWLLGIPGYIFPWTFFYGSIAVLLWVYFTPSLETMKTFQLGWISYLLIRNLIIMLICGTALHFLLYIKKTQGDAFKFNPSPMSKNNKNFFFKDQTKDNIFWTLCSGVPIWTAFEVFSLWAFANGYFIGLEWIDHPIYLGLTFLIIPLFREVHFYFVHRLLHTPLLYNFCHHVHHKNVNPGPWSGLSMHWFEHVLYFTGTLIHFIIPAHPVHAVFQLLHAAIGPLFHGHIGFDSIVIGKTKIDTHSHAHYLHHKYFECNYADGAIPLDKLFGTFHNGSEEAQEKMMARYKLRSKKMRSTT